MDYKKMAQTIADLKKSTVTKAKAMEILKVALTKSEGGTRKTGFSFDGGSAGKVTPQWFQKSQAKGIELEYQKRADNLYLIAQILKVNPRNTMLFQKYAEDTEFNKAMDTVENADWIPTQLSAKLQDEIHLALKVAALHGRVPMPTQPYELPYVAGQTTAYLVGEAVAEDSSRFTKSSMKSAKVTFDAKKIGARVLLSEEITEDSIIPVLPLIKKDIKRALSFAIEDATVNGDTSGTHQDSDVTGAKDARKAWMGYRKLAQASLDLVNVLTATKLRQLRGLMGVYGVNPTDLALVVSIAGYLQLIDLTEVKTVDKYGNNATIIKGELAKIDNIPIIVSEKCRDDLNVSGVYDGMTETRTGMSLVYRDALLFGDRRAVTVKTDFDIERDQNILVATQRLAFNPVFASTETFVAYGYNCPKLT